nr:hypothetical protein [Candidatus Sigynarchaeota archaeon]
MKLISQSPKIKWFSDRFNRNARFRLAIILLLIQAIVLVIYWILVQDGRKILEGFLASFSIVPTEAIVVVLILSHTLEKKNQEERVNRMNMATQLFFSEIGTNLIRFILKYEAHKEELKKELIIKQDIEDSEFTRIATFFEIFHLNEELAHREGNIAQLPESDYLHLNGDIMRVFKSLLKQWIIYLKHLKDRYPFLFSLALRTNPFDPNASIIIK